MLCKGVTFVNEYALMVTLGRGSFGKVKLALNTLDSQLYALKLLPKGRRRQIGSPGTNEIIKHEIEVMKSLSHPNVVRLFEVIGKLLLRLNLRDLYLWHLKMFLLDSRESQWVH